MRGRTRRGQRAGPGRADAALPQPGPCRPRPPRPAAFRGALGTPARGREAWPRGALGARSGRGGRARLASSPWRASVCGVSGPAPEPRSLRPAHPASRLGPGPSAARPPHRREVPPRPGSNHACPFPLLLTVFPVSRPLRAPTSLGGGARLRPPAAQGHGRGLRWNRNLPLPAGL